MNLKCLVPFMYLAVFLIKRQSPSLGACELRVARCTANAISGRVHRLIPRRLLPTIDWNICTVGLCDVPLPPDGSSVLPASPSFPSSPQIGTLTDADLDNSNFSYISSMTHFCVLYPAGFGTIVEHDAKKLGNNADDRARLLMGQDITDGETKRPLGMGKLI